MFTATEKCGNWKVSGGFEMEWKSKERSAVKLGTRRFIPRILYVQKDISKIMNTRAPYSSSFIRNTPCSITGTRVATEKRKAMTDDWYERAVQSS